MSACSYTPDAALTLNVFLLLLYLHNKAHNGIVL